MNDHPLSGVYAAVVTPLQADFSPALEHIPALLSFMASRGCHGALLLGTTGEGPSFSPDERLAIFQAALTFRSTHPDFHLLAGTGTPSLEETIQLTQAAFELGMDGVVVLPPYYYRKASDEGLFAWFDLLIQRAVPPGKYLLGYHIPHVSGVGLSLDLLEKLANRHPGRFAGIKDSSGDPEHARLLGERFGKDLLVLTGNDRLFSHALANHASGCITAAANIISPILRRVWDAHTDAAPAAQAQTELDACRQVVDAYPPAPALLKALLHYMYKLPASPVRLPLQDLPPSTVDKALAELAEISIM